MPNSRLLSLLLLKPRAELGGTLLLLGVLIDPLIQIRNLLRTQVGACPLFSVFGMNAPLTTEHRGLFLTGKVRLIGQRLHLGVTVRRGLQHQIVSDSAQCRLGICTAKVRLSVFLLWSQRLLIQPLDLGDVRFSLGWGFFAYLLRFCFTWNSEGQALTLDLGNYIINLFGTLKNYFRFNDLWACHSQPRSHIITLGFGQSVIAGKDLFRVIAGRGGYCTGLSCFSNRRLSNIRCNRNHSI